MTTTIGALAGVFRTCQGTIPDEQLDEMINATDPALHKTFFAGDKDAAKEAVKSVTKAIVEMFLNNPNQDAVPLRKKTKFLLVLNNFVLHKAVRQTVFTQIKACDGLFEDSMKKEGSMPFDSELGRMSEHVLVLLMRCMNYKLKAAFVNEFADGNTQFAVQLLLAILLKEPPYEFELRVNCITGLLGFTQPQAFFAPGDAIEFNDCASFSAKVDFIANLTTRLSALQVVNDVIAPMLLDFPTVQPLVHISVTATMRFVMNIFQFVSTGASQWRQHVLLSTPFVDSVSVLYIQAQVRSLESLLTVSMAQAVPSLPPELLPGLSLALKFCSFATFHMGRHAKALRPLCAFAHDLLSLPVRACLASDTLGRQMAQLYGNLFHFLSNIDALAGDDGVVDESQGDELIDELRSATLRATLRAFLSGEVASGAGGAALLEAWHTKFYSVDTDALVSQDCATFQEIDGLFVELKKSSAPAAAAPAPAPAAAARAAGGSGLLGDMPTLFKQAQANAPKKAAAVAGAEPVFVQQTLVAPKKASAPSAEVPSQFVCALNGHTMKNPVVSPYGHTFEKDTIEQWLKQQGSVCPLTGKPLSIADLKPNKAVQSEIMKMVVQQSMSSYNQENDSDLYDF